MSKILNVFLVLSLVVLSYCEPQRFGNRSRNRFLARQEASPTADNNNDGQWSQADASASGAAPYPAASTPSGPAFELPNETTVAPPADAYGPPDDTYGPPSDSYGPPSTDSNSQGAAGSDPIVDQPQAERFIVISGNPRSGFSSSQSFAKLLKQQGPFQIQRVVRL